MRAAFIVATSLNEPITDKVRLSSLKLNRALALDVIHEVATALDLTVDSVQERPRLFSIKILVTLTGDRLKIASFRDTCNGREGLFVPLLEQLLHS